MARVRKFKKGSISDDGYLWVDGVGRVCPSLMNANGDYTQCRANCLAFEVIGPEKVNHFICNNKPSGIEVTTLTGRFFLELCPAVGRLEFDEFHDEREEIGNEGQDR